VLVNKLCGLSLRIEKNRECVEAANIAAELDAIGEIDRNTDPFLSDLVQKHIL
jgi:hypothetical protein